MKKGRGQGIHSPEIARGSFPCPAAGSSAGAGRECDVIMTCCRLTGGSSASERERGKKEGRGAGVRAGLLG